MSEHEKSEHRRVENTEDFTEWNWGDGPDQPATPSDEIVVGLFKEWAENIAGDVHENSCAAGAKIAFEELAENGFFVLRGITDKGLLVEFIGTGQFVIYDELDIVDEALNYFDDPQIISSHLRRLADAIDAGTQEEEPPSTPRA